MATAKGRTAARTTGGKRSIRGERGKPAAVTVNGRAGTVNGAAGKVRTLNGAGGTAADRGPEEERSRDTAASHELSGVAPISVEHLSKVYKGVTAVDDLTFEVQWGRVTAFLGPNGAGKTTTLRSVLGLIEPTSGSATVLGRRYADLDKPARRVGAVLETTNFHPRRKARDHLRILAEAAGVPVSRVDDVLRVTGLADAAGRRIGAFSLGMRQRLGLAGALLGGPRVLILDEPANGLDPQGIRWLRRSLQKFAEQGNAVLVSSHLLSEVEHLADDLIVIDRGRLVTSGSVAELTQGRSDLESVYFELMKTRRA